MAQAALCASRCLRPASCGRLGQQRLDALGDLLRRDRLAQHREAAAEGPIDVLATLQCLSDYAAEQGDGRSASILGKAAGLLELSLVTPSLRLLYARRNPLASSWLPRWLKTPNRTA